MQRIEGHKRTEGGKMTSLYNVWCSMKSRCLDFRCAAYPRYGGRGISICQEWLSDFNTFGDWMIASGWKQGLSIDRVDNDQGYYPSNCQIISRVENTIKASIRPVVCIDTGEEFESLKVASKSVFRTPEALSTSIKRGGRSAGYSWEYA